MKGYSCGVWRTVLFAAVLCAVSSPLQAQGFKWWQNEPFQKRLGLTSDQSRRIEDVFQAALPNLRRAKQQLDSQEGELSKLVNGAAEDAALAQQVERVEAARSELNKTRTLMLLRIRRILTADQRVKLDAIHKERERERDHKDHDKTH